MASPLSALHMKASDSFKIHVKISNDICARFETFEKCSILLKAKEGDNFNHKNTLSILRIKIWT